MRLLLVEAREVTLPIITEELAVGALRLAALLLDGRGDHRNLDLDLDDDNNGCAVVPAEIVGLVLTPSY